MSPQTYREVQENRSDNIQKQHMAQQMALLLEPSLRDIQMLLELYSFTELPAEEELTDPVPDEEFLDPPEMEDNLETGEDIGTEMELESYPEDFWLYSGRRLEEDYGEDLNDDILEAFETVRQQGSVPEKSELRAFFENVEKSYPMPPELSGNKLVTEPDIIFAVEGEELRYSVNVGPLEKAITLNDIFQIDALCSSLGISQPILTKAVMLRKQNLARLADFLASKQRDFLFSRNVPEALSKLNPSAQKDFAAFVRKKYKETFDASRASRTIKNKWIRVPFQPEPLTAALFFGQLPYNFIIKISEAAAGMLNGNSVAAPVYNVIYRLLTGEKITNRQMGNYLKSLTSILPKGNGRNKTLRSINDQELLEIASKACELLGMEERDNLTVDAIQKIKDSLK